MTLRTWATLLLAGCAIAACAGGGAPGTASGALPPAPGASKKSGTIQHLIIVIQENRSFDNLFATFPNADGTTTGQAAAMPPSLQKSCPSPVPQATSIPLTKTTLVGAGFPNNFGEGNDLNHVWNGYQTDYDGGKMDGFDLTGFGPDGSGSPACTYPYQYVDPNQIKPYWNMAKQYVLADHMFQTQGSGTFTAHQDLIAGGTMVDSTDSVIDNPTWFPWGCDSLQSTVTSLLTTAGKYLQDQGPRPCMTYETMRDLLDAGSVSWKYYAVAVQKPGGKDHGDTPGIWSAFDAIKAVRYSSEWGKNVTKSDTLIFKDITNGTLPAVSWITPDAQNSDHPQERIKGKLVDTGPSWVASIVNSVGKSKYWNSSAVIVLWDDWGGFYDHESPAFLDNMGGLGFRVPMIVISPYVIAPVEHTQYEFGSILRFIEENWGLGSLGTTDVRATSIGNIFNLKAKPRPFQPLTAKYPLSFFLHQKPSGIPPDSL